MLKNKRFTLNTTVAVFSMTLMLFTVVNIFDSSIVNEHGRLIETSVGIFPNTDLPFES